MERLSDNAIEIINDLHTERLDYGSEYLPLIDAANRLSYYEDMEEQGRLVVLPFLPNEDVWDYSEFFCGTPYAEYYKLRDSFIGVGISADGKRTFEYDCFTIDPEQIGKTIFLSHEEAEKALKEDAQWS